MTAPTPEQMRKFFDTFFELIERGRIASWDMDALTVELESGIWRMLKSDTAGHELPATLPPERLRLLMKPVEELGWTKGSRVPVALRWAGVERVWQLAVRTEPELLKARGIGRTTVNEIRTQLEAHGLSLGMELFKGAPPPKPPE